ncbi:MAG TPA: hypothetical protein VII38_22480 [Polyangia bacterium]
MKWATALVAVVISGAAGLPGCRRAPDVEIGQVPLSLDREERVAGQPLTPSTESVNRYHSILSRFDAVDLRLDGRSERISVGFRARGDDQGQLTYRNIDAHFLVPLLDYPHARTLDDFDKVNLMLAEYSRSGVTLAFQKQNRSYGYFSARDLFNDDEEYRYDHGNVLPNPGARPRRMSLNNNCLMPGLWEVNASDSVGEMYHAWFTLPEAKYFALVRAVDGLDDSDAVLRQTLAYRKDLGHFQLDGFGRGLDQLREVVYAFGTFPVAVNLDKPVASYSTQDSRRKVQHKFYRVTRAGAEIHPVTFADLKPGDVFEFHSFIPPGVYTDKVPRKVPYEPIWTSAEIREVKPKTRFEHPSPHRYPFGALELELRSADGQRELVVGNLPVDLLVFQEDYDVPGFGVGILRASEPIEKRYLFLKDGPAPVYAFSTRVVNGKLEVVNNHEQGLEQIYLRPYRQGDQVLLRVTLVSYERIVDLGEFDVTLPAELQQKILRASASYHRPLWRSFSDSNIL